MKFVLNWTSFRALSYDLDIYLITAVSQITVILKHRLKYTQICAQSLYKHTSISIALTRPGSEILK